MALLLVLFILVFHQAHSKEESVLLDLKHLLIEAKQKVPPFVASMQSESEKFLDIGVNWIVSNKPVMYRDNIILTCKTRQVLTDRGVCRVRQWYGGHKDNILLYNGVSADPTKYEDRTNISSTEFSLVIKNYTESDLNINYTFSCDFKSYTKCLGLNDKDFIVPPLRVDTHIQQSNETLSIYLHVERVYPRPECFIVIGERTVFINETLTFVKCDAFFNATCEASFNIVDDDCGKKPTLLCYIGNEYNIVNTSGDSMLNCTEVRGDMTGYNSTSTESYTAKIVIVMLVVFLVSIVCLAVVFYTRTWTCTCICRSIQKRKEIENGIHSDNSESHNMLSL